MGSWAEFEREAPELAAAVRERFDVRKHATMATLRVDGSPRISGTEVAFTHGQLVLGSMPNARKALAKEVVVGIGNGLSIGLLAAGVATLFRGDPMIGLLLGAAMFINLGVAAAAGTLIPLGLRALKVDPALASSVFITTLTDVAGFASFLGLATIFLRFLR